MKRFTKAILASSVAAALAAPMAVQAQAPAAAPASDHTFTGNFGLFSQYIFRGLTQTDRKPALQGGFDYAHSSGFYAGIWGSNISWITDGYAPGGSYSAEFDTYLGFKMPVGDFTFDVGFLRYNYPGSKPRGGFPAGTDIANTNELYGAASWKWLTFKYSYSLGDTFGIKDSKGTDYMDLTGTFPIMDSGFSLVAHYGRQNYKGTNAAGWAGTGLTQNALDYKDWRIAVTKELMGLNFAVGYSKADTKSAVYTNNFGRNIGEGTWTASVQKSF
jgi:uncharacterized protein (TIGR02001 family)